MTPQEAQDLLKNKDQFWKLVEAVADGRGVEFCDNTNGWHLKEPDLWDMAVQNERYRIKPEPREFWLVGDFRFNRLETANDYLAGKGANGYPTCEIIHVREVPLS